MALGVPPVQRWWVTYVLIACGAVIAAATLIGIVVEALRPLQPVLLLLLLLFAVVRSFALSSIVGVVEGRIGGRHGIVVAIVVLASTVLWVGAVLLFVSPLLSQAQVVAVAAPDLLERIQRGDDVEVARSSSPISSWSASCRPPSRCSRARVSRPSVSRLAS
jgi:hypothetical protein